MTQPRRPDQQFVPPGAILPPQSQSGIFSRLFVGGDFVINKNGAFFYNGTPAAGNLAASITSALISTDPFGNVVFDGYTIYWSVSGTAYALSFGAPSASAGMTAYSSPTGQAGPYTGASHTAVASGSTFITSRADLGLSPAVGGAVEIGVPSHFTAYLTPSGDAAGVTDAANIATLLGLTDSVYLLPGVFWVNSIIQLPGNVTLQGAGIGETTIRAAAASGIAAVIATQGWSANTNTGSVNPVNVRDLTIDGNSTATYGLVSQNFWSYFERLLIENTTSDGLRFDVHGAGGSVALAGTAVENRIIDCQIRGVGGVGIHVADNTHACFTDGWLLDCAVAGVGAASSAIFVEAGAGWRITGNHLYGTIGNSGIAVSRAFATQVSDNYIEGWGQNASSGTYCGIDFGYGSDPASMADQGFGSVISDNRVQFGVAVGNNASTIVGIATKASSGGSSTVVFDGNTITPVTANLPSGTSPNGIYLSAQDGTSVLDVAVSGNLYPGAWPGGNFAVSTSTNLITITYGTVQRTVLRTPFTSTTGTGAQTVTGMAITLQPGTYRLRAVAPLSSAGVVGGTQTPAWTWGGTASSANGAWRMTGALAVTAAVITAITTSGPASPTMTAAGMVLEFDGHIVVTAAGALQMTITSSVSGDEVTFPLGSYIEAEPVQA